MSGWVELWLPTQAILRHLVTTRGSAQQIRGLNIVARAALSASRLLGLEQMKPPSKVNAIFWLWSAL